MSAIYRPDCVYLATYIAKGNWANSAIRWRSGADSSHSEVATDVATLNGVTFGVCRSSSFKDDGVRAKLINLSDPTKWRLTPAPWVTQAEVLAFFEATEGLPYDLPAWAGAAFDLPWLQNPNQFTCSEWCRRVLLPDAPMRTGVFPGRLENAVIDRYRQWRVQQ